MSVPLTINGVTYDFPTVDDTDWGYSVTAWAEAITANIFPKTGGNFFLSADLNFGPAAGILARNFSTFNANPASAGVLRLSNTDTIAWRNAANTGDYALSLSEVGGVPKLKIGTNEIIDANSTQTLSNKTLVNPTFTGTISISIAPNSAAVSDSAGKLTASATSSTQVGYLSNVTSDVQAQINGKQAADGDLTAISGLTGQGLAVRTGTNQWATRVITSSDNSLAVTNPDGFGGNINLTIGNVPFSKIVSLPGTISGYGITDAVQNAGGVPTIGAGIAGSRPVTPTTGQLYLDVTNSNLLRWSGTSWKAITSPVLAIASLPTTYPQANAAQSMAIGDGVVTSGLGSTAIGLNATTGSQGAYGLALGRNTAANFQDSTVLGNYGTTEYVGQIAFGTPITGNFKDLGLNSITTLGVQQASNGALELRVDVQNGNFLVTQNNHTYLYDVDVIGRDITNLAAQNYVAWNLKFTFIRGATAATCILPGVQKTLVGAGGTGSTWTVTVTADTVNGRPAIKVTGGSISATVNWSAFVKTARVSNAL